MSTWTYVNIKGQGHSLTLVQGHSDSTFSNFFSWETARPIEVKFHVEPHWDGRMKVCSNGPGLMTKMAAMPIYVKNMKRKILLLWNQKADDLESLYAASGTRVLPSLFKSWSWVDLDLFYDKVKFGSRQGQIWFPMLLYGKIVKQWIFLLTWAFRLIGELMV